MYTIRKYISKYFRMKLKEEKTIEEIYSYKENSFNIVRLLLAISVIYSHCYPLMGINAGDGDILERLTKGQLSFGSLAVYCFFIISGFLITQSMMNSKNFLQYIIKRLLRIFPAFFSALIFSAFIIGPIVSNFTFNEYFSMVNITEPIKFIWKNLTMNIFGYSWGFLDAFNNTPFPGSVNGSMWTLKHEVACYIVVMLLSYFYIFRNRLIMLFLAILTSALTILNLICGYKLFSLSENFWIISDAQYNSFIILFCFFIMGSLIYVFKDKIIINYRFLLLATIIMIFSCKAGNLKIISLFVLPYLLIGICIITNIKSITKYGDFSYGMYIYAFPIQQTIVYFWADTINLFTYCIFSIVITFIISIISWNFIEKPALSLKRIFNY